MIDRRETTYVWLASLFACAVALFFFSENNRFPYTYHPDEPVKVQQIITGERLYYHPLLLLTTANWVAEWGGLKSDPQAVVIAGRWCSAMFAAAAVVLLANLARRWTGWAGFAMAGLFLVANTQLYELAHYFKEDPALLVGLAASFSALAWFWQRPGRVSAFALGAGCGLAMSGKYAGVVVLIFALPMVMAQRQRTGWQGLGFTLLGIASAWLLFNHPALWALEDLQAGLAREIAKTTLPEVAETALPNWRIVRTTVSLTPPLVMLGLLAWLGRWMVDRTFRSWPGLLTFIFPFFYLALLLFWPKASDRYLLPTLAFLVLNGCIGLAAWLQAWTGKSRWMQTCGVLLLLGAFVLTSGHDIRKARKEFRENSRMQMREWIERKLPKEAVFATDKVVQLQADPTWRKRRVESRSFAADLGTISELQEQGVTHVIVGLGNLRSYNRAEGYIGTEKMRADFYRELDSDFPQVWKANPGFNSYLRPGLAIYAIKPGPSAP